MRTCLRRSSVCLLSSNLLVGCVTTNDNRAANAYAVPSNYRQLIARKIIEGTAHIGPIRSAAISQPADRFVGLVNGGTRPVVCATTTADGRFIPTTTRWLVLFENGQITSAIVNPGAIYCAGVPEEPFPEVVKRT
jgi:hypothetical protein